LGFSQTWKSLIGIFQLTRHQGAIRKISHYFFSMEIPLLPMLMSHAKRRHARESSRDLRAELFINENTGTLPGVLFG